MTHTSVVLVENFQNSGGQSFPEGNNGRETFVSPYLIHRFIYEINERKREIAITNKQ